MTQANETNFKNEVLTANLPVVVDFWAPWCGPCKAVAPVFEDLAKEYSGKVKFVKVNIDENPALAAQYGIMSIPTLVFFSDGKAVGQVVGAIGKSELKKKIQEALG